VLAWPEYECTSNEWPLRVDAAVRARARRAATNILTSGVGAAMRRRAHIE
jgi:hypothetical protein